MKHWQYRILFAWVNLAQAIVGVLTFGIWYPNWLMPFARWYALYDIERSKREKERLNF